MSPQHDPPGGPLRGPADDPALLALRHGVRRVLADLPGPAPLRPPDDGGTVVVACSGGPDSLALLAATVAEARRLSPRRRVVGATVDHDLQDGSADHAAGVVETMARLGADETLTARVRVEESGQGPEAAAREARYAVLEQVATSTGAAAVLLGHTLDDQAETVLLGLTRGSGGRSIAGMRPRFGVFRRPLLECRRDQTVAACRALGVRTWSDPHNDDPRFTRVRVRRAVLPLLEEELGPGVAETLARTAALLRPDAEALDGYADRALDEALREPGLDLDVLRTHPDAVVTRVLRLMALRAGSPAAELFHVHVSALHDLVTGAVRGQVQLPGHVTAYVAEGLLRFVRTAG